MSKENGSIYDSKEEEYFHWWLLELQLAGYVESIKRECESYKLNEKVVAEYEITKAVKAKTKVIAQDYVLIKEKHYTPDFEVEWTDKAKGIFTFQEGDLLVNSNVPFFFLHSDYEMGEMDNHTSYIEVKGAFTRNLSSSITFPDRQVMMLKEQGIYVQKIIPFDVSGKVKSLFQLTFTPSDVIQNEVYKVQTKNNKVGESKLKYPVRTLKQFEDEWNT